MDVRFTFRDRDNWAKIYDKFWVIINTPIEVNELSFPFQAGLKLMILDMHLCSDSMPTLSYTIY